MRVSDGRAAELKTWVTKKLEDISDADADVLADYVIALIRSDIPESDLQRSVIENLEDFLKDNTTAFVDELLKAVTPQTNLQTSTPAAPKFIPSVASGPQTPFAALSGPYARPATENPRKRYIQALQGQASPPRQYGRYDRQAKRVRGGAPTRGPGSRVVKPSHSKSRPGLPFDPQQAAAALWTLEAMGFPLPHLSADAGRIVPSFSEPTWARKGNGEGAVRCKDYDTIGICQRGANCPYLHDANQIIMAPGGTAPRNGRTQSGREKGKQGPADFSQIDPGHDSSMSSIIVENIPKEYLNEGSVVEFFSAFGEIQQVQLQPESKLAMVQFAKDEAALAAYQSPKVIFDNRFVKVYRYNPKRNRSKDKQEEDEQSFDREAFEKDLEAAQKRFEERKALKDENDAKVLELQQRRDELQRRKEGERQKLLEKIREKRPSDSANDEQSTTDVLRAKLKWLEEEAESLGLEPTPWDSGHTGYGKGRGTYRGRGEYRGQSSRGAYRGGRGGLPGGGAYNLDNRSKIIKVEGTEFDPTKDEALRQYLINVGDFTSIEPEPSGTSQTITFNDRRTAEKFFYGPRDIPGVGKLEISWVERPRPTLQKISSNTDEDMGGDGNDGSDAERYGRYDEREEHSREMDYDVAEDEER